MLPVYPGGNIILLTQDFQELMGTSVIISIVSYSLGFYSADIERIP